MEYVLEKEIWTEADFDRMGWRDNSIYKVALSSDLELDIDYIFKWNEPEVPGMPFTFWIAPATLVFKEVRSLALNIDLMEDAFEIEDIEKEAADNGWLWRIVTRRGEIEFISPGYEQFIRQKPTYQYALNLDYMERQGFSLERVTNRENPYLASEHYKLKQERNAELYDYAKKRKIKKIELDELTRRREEGQIGTKEFLIARKELEDIIYSHGYWLKGTPFEQW